MSDYILDPARSECPLCGNREDLNCVTGPDRREYLLCGECALIFVIAKYHLDLKDERARYELHNNSIADAGYCAFLTRLLNPMLAYLEPGMRGVDYGCGPGPTLSKLAEREGLTCEDYDPIFLKSELKASYDFIFATECFEHFHNPARDIPHILDILKPGGYLGVMTDIWKSIDAFSNWHYSRDETHVCFYSIGTIEFIADRYRLEMLWSDSERVFIFRKRLVH